jgi:2-oxoglutarate ferredoxin oxidoreductase subunit beta
MNTTYKREDFTKDIDVRWCPGCGDYAILNALQRVLPELGLPPEKHVFVSGIGCAGRLPYYMNTYGFHTIHGRATAVATGLKAMREDLSVWVITGDGDALSIGANHLIHCLRRNLNITILLFNNQVYGLTKGQYSPTSPQGQITKTSPEGLTQAPVNPLSLALGAGATFVARAVDKDPVHLASILKQAHDHEGCSFVEIYQDCNIFNNGAFDAFAVKGNRADNTVILETDKPLVYGREKVPNGDSVSYRHDPTEFIKASRLAHLTYPEYPVFLGVYYQIKRPVFALKYAPTKSMEDLVALYKE